MLSIGLRALTQFGEKVERILNQGRLRMQVFRTGSGSQIQRAVSGEATAVT